MQPDFDDPQALVPQELNAQGSRAYEERTANALREHMIGSTAGSVIVDEIELVGSRPETRIVFRYHHHPGYLGRHADLVEGPRAEAARLWEFAIDPDDHYSGGMMEPPQALAAAIASAFDAAELPLVDPVTLTTIGEPPKVFPRVMSDAVADQMRRKFEAWRSAQDDRCTRASTEDE
jgi:hypothetical protein